MNEQWLGKRVRVRVGETVVTGTVAVLERLDGDPRDQIAEVRLPVQSGGIRPGYRRPVRELELAE